MYMSNLLTSLAFVKTNIDNGTSIWDSLVRLMLFVIKEKDINDVSTEKFCTEFNTYYDINVPMHPMNTIIGKIKKMGIIDDQYGKWILNKKIIKEISIHTREEEDYNGLLLDIQVFIRERFSLEKSAEEIEKLFIGFMNVYDGDIFIAIEQKSVLPKIEMTDAEKYIISCFVEYLVSTESPKLGILESALLANIHINSIFFVESSRKLKLNRAYVYLDTRILLRLTGIEGEFRKDEYLNLIKILFDNSSVQNNLK
jgi:hypothetical protein